jgi:hypothetical protein
MATHASFNRPPELQNRSRVALASGDQFCPSGSPAPTSSRYAEDVNNVQQLGGLTSSARTTEQTEIALFGATLAAREISTLGERLNAVLLQTFCQTSSGFAGQLSVRRKRYRS